jgi:hypothetical protein
MVLRNGSITSMIIPCTVAEATEPVTNAVVLNLCLLGVELQSNLFAFIDDVRKHPLYLRERPPD